MILLTYLLTYLLTSDLVPTQRHVDTRRRNHTTEARGDLQSRRRDLGLTYKEGRRFTGVRTF